MNKSLGLLEVRGLASAIYVADAMSKAAAVTLLGVETAKGGGWMTIRLLGDVAAVQAAISTGAMLAKARHCFIAEKTLPRPDHAVLAQWGITADKPADHSPSGSSNLEGKDAPIERALANTEHDASVVETSTVETSAVETSALQENAVNENAVDDDVLDKYPVSLAAEPESADDSAYSEPAPTVSAQASCNLCNDPSCRRQKGEPRSKCRHFSRAK